MESVEYNNRGCLFLPSHLAKDCAAIKAAVRLETESAVIDQAGPTPEMDNTTYAQHLSNTTLRNLISYRPLLSKVRALLGVEDVYVHQFKINHKLAFGPDHFRWHQDLGTWAVLDGIEKSKMITAMIFIDEIDEFNSPLFLIPMPADTPILPYEGQLDFTRYSADDYDWRQDSSNKRSLVTSTAVVTECIEKYGIESIRGPAGSVLFFGPTLLHASGLNLSSRDRAAIFISYNCMDNEPNDSKASRRREAFLCGRDRTALKMVDCL